MSPEMVRSATRRLIVAALRLTSPLHRPVDRLATSLIGGRSLLLFVAHLHVDLPGDEGVRPLLALLSEKCRLLPLSEAFEQMRRGTLPERSAVLFVDDATRTFYDTAYPVLRSMDIPFVLSIIPGLIPADDRIHLMARVLRVAGLEYARSPHRIAAACRHVLGARVELDGYPAFFRIVRELETPRLVDLIGELKLPDDPFMRWSELAEVLAEGRVELANHSMSHPLMRHVEGDWLDFEIGEAGRRIERRLGVRVCDFVFPVGTAENAGPHVVDALRRHGYRAAYLVRMGVVRDPEQFLLPRAPLEVRAPLRHVATSHAANAIAGLVQR